MTRSADDSDAGNDDNVYEEIYWEYMSDDGVLQRLEVHDQHGPTEYEVMLEANTAVLHYTEDEEEASMEDMDTSTVPTPTENLFKTMLEAVQEEEDEDYEVEMDEVNGEEAYHLQTSSRDFWFRAEDYAEIQLKSPSAENPIEIVEVSTHEWNPEFDNSLFEAEEIVPEDVTIIDRRSDNP